MRLLIVDDNIDAAELLAEAFREGGHTVLTAYDGPQAISVARTFQPTTILMDINLPVMDGYEVAARIRETLAPATPPRVIAITGYGQAADREKSRAAGIELHLAKPVDLETLEQLLT
jgi:CheY-like chemotaxis protein